MTQLKKAAAFLLTFIMLFSLTAVASAQEYSASTKGFAGDVTVTLTIEEGVITAASATGDLETDGIGTKPLEQMPQAMVQANSVLVDAVSSATITSQAILDAAKQALAQAGLAPEDLAAKDVVPQEKDPIKPAFENPDVIIIGAGFTGMNAAIAAADAGAKVYLIEKNDEVGGSIRFAGGTTSAAGAKMQIEAGVEDTPENFADDIVRMGGGTNIAELTKKHTENAAAAIDWLDELGADFGDRQPQMSSSYDAFNVPREYRVQGGGKAMVDVIKPLLDAHIEKGNVSLMLETEVADIVIEDGAVKGVILNDENATQFLAPSTILATGGYGHNEELLHKYNYANVLTMAPAFATGDGYLFAEKAGAAFSNMDYLPAYPGGVPNAGFDLTTSAKVTEYPSIWVNTNGNRIVNEFNALDSERKAAYSNSPENLVYMIISQEIRDSQESIISKDENWEKFDAMLAEENCVYKADTLEGLAEKIGVNSENLVKTVEAYNAFAHDGEDKDFARPKESMIPLEGPFYAVKTCPYVMLTKGGPLMNPEAQVLNTDNQPIAGLYQAGELAGGANIGGSANIGGLANTSCVVWGKIAGENAAAYALAQK